MASKKHYIITSITLGVIAMASGALIGVTNMITKDKIAKNEQNRITSGITSIFGDDSEVKEEKEITGYAYSNYLYEVEYGESDILGYAIKTTGSNMYGKISLIVGFRSDIDAFIGMYVITNEQTYASTLVENYINPVNAGEKNYDGDDDVKCGATYGAKLIRDMINDAKEVVKTL